MNSCSTTVLLTFTVLRLQLLDNWIEHTNDMVRNLAFCVFFLISTFTLSQKKAAMDLSLNSLHHALL